MKKLETCHHCGEEKENCYHGYIAMTIPIPEAEALIEKWNLIDAYENFINNPAYKADSVAELMGSQAGQLVKCSTQEEFNNKIKTDPEFSKKWYTKDWWKNLEREDLTEEEIKELDGLCTYDQLLSTVGRGVQCEDCGKKEAELYDRYYPRVGS